MSRRCRMLLNAFAGSIGFVAAGSKDVWGGVGGYGSSYCTRSTEQGARMIQFLLAIIDVATVKIHKHGCHTWRSPASP